MIERAASWYRLLGSSRRVSIVALVAANVIPIIGVLFFKWSLITILVLYWLENGIVGLWNIPRIALARGSAPATASAGPPAMFGQGCERYAVIPFFVFHYGLFWVVHGVFTSPCYSSRASGA